MSDIEQQLYFHDTDTVTESAQCLDCAPYSQFKKSRTRA